MMNNGDCEYYPLLSDFVVLTHSARININMSEYHDRHTISRLIGAAPGYVGFEEGGQLDEIYFEMHALLTLTFRTTHGSG